MNTRSKQTEHWNRCLIKVGESHDRVAFAELIRHFSPLLISFMLKAGDTTNEDAEDLVQETLIDVWNKAADFLTSQASAYSWIFTLARNIRYDWMKGQTDASPEGFRAEILYSDNTEPPESVIKLHNKQLIRQRLEQLPEEQGKVLYMMFIEGMSSQEIAIAIDLPPSQVKLLIRLALQNLILDMAPE